MTGRPGAMLAAHGVTRHWFQVVVLTWAGLIAVTGISLPLKYPHDLHRDIMDTGLVLGVVLPIAAMGRLLDEGPATLVATASKRQWPSRLAWGTAFLAGIAIPTGVMAAILPVPPALAIGDGLLLAGTALLGAAALGAGNAWIAPLAIAVAASAPGVLPWPVNIFYRPSLGGWTLFVAAAVASIGLGAYGCWGGLGRRHRHGAEHGGMPVRD